MPEWRCSSSNRWLKARSVTPDEVRAIQAAVWFFHRATGAKPEVDCDRHAIGNSRAYGLTGAGGALTRKGGLVLAFGEGAVTAATWASAGERRDVAVPAHAPDASAPATSAAVRAERKVTRLGSQAAEALP